QLQLEDLPGWSLRRGGRAIVRSFDLPEMESALAFLDYLSDLGAVRERLPEIDLRPGKATVSIKTPSAGWLERPDFELALAMKFRGQGEDDDDRTAGTSRTAKRRPTGPKNNCLGDDGIVAETGSPERFAPLPNAVDDKQTTMAQPQTPRPPKQTGI